MHRRVRSLNDFLTFAKMPARKSRTSNHFQCATLSIENRSASMNSLPFVKMHGLGNDFVVIDARSEKIALDADLVRWIGDRHRGVGFDQLVLVESDDTADARIRFFNADASVSGACGNATRCLGAWLSAETGRDDVELLSDAGLLRTMRLSDGRIEALMSEPRFAWFEIPVAHECNTLTLPVEHPELPEPVGVSMGNPHAVFFLQEVDRIEEFGGLLEWHPLFPERANIGFARVENRGRIRLRVHERGAGLTLACGSGACAAHVAAFRRGLVDERTIVEVDGGELEIAWNGSGPVFMTGPAAISFRGVIDLAEVDA